MIKHLFYITLFASITSYAQVGIGTENPISTLHVKEKRDVLNNNIDLNSKDGILIPRLTKQELADKSEDIYNSTTTGTLVFVKEVSENVTGPSETETESIENIGYYYYNGNKWVPIAGDGLDNTNNAWVNNPAQTRVELGSTSNGLTRQNNTQVVITDNGYVGINVENPTKRLEIDAATSENTSDVLRIKNLATPLSNTITSTLQIDSEGNVGKKSEENVEGQILRLPIKTAKSAVPIPINTPYGIRIDTETLNAPNGAPNLINMITGSSNTVYDYGGDLITDRIKLPAGIYKIEVKILGNFGVANVNNSINLKTQINGLEYSSQDFGSSTVRSRQRYTGFVATDLIKLDTEASIDFIIEAKQNDFQLIGAVGIGGGSSYRSLILIQRLK